MQSASAIGRLEAMPEGMSERSGSSATGELEATTSLPRLTRSTDILRAIREHPPIRTHTRARTPTLQAEQQHHAQDIVDLAHFLSSIISVPRPSLAHLCVHADMAPILPRSQNERQLFEAKLEHANRQVGGGGAPLCPHAMAVCTTL